MDRLFEAGLAESIFWLFFRDTFDLLIGLTHDLIVPLTGPAPRTPNDDQRLGVLRHLELVAAA